MDRHGANKFITYLGALPNQPCSDRDCWNRSRWFRIAQGRVLEQEMDILTDAHTHTRRCSTSQRIILPCIIHEMHIIASIMIAVTHTQPHTHTHAHAHSSTPQWLCIQNIFACDGRRNPRIYLFMCVCVCVGGWLGICGYPVALLIVELDGRYELNFISVIHTFPMPFFCCITKWS